MAPINPPWRFDPFQMPVNVSWGAAPGGDYVLVQFTANSVTGDYYASSPTGSSISYVVDPTNGTECALTVDVTGLFPGAQIVYRQINLHVTPTTSWRSYLLTTATLQITDTDLGSDPFNCSNDDRAAALALLESETPLPPSTSIKIGYHNDFALTSGVGNSYSTEAAADANAAAMNAGGVGSVGASGGYTVPTCSSPGPYEQWNLDILWVPYLVTSGTFYAATFSATYVIQLPFAKESPPPPPEIPAFSIHTTGYPWSAEISVFPKQGIALDPTNPAFPLKWETGHPPLGADGHPWAPFGAPDDNVQNAFLWKIFYEDQAGTAAPQDYPFAIVVEDHLTAEPPPSPVNPNVRNAILQVYPTFVSTLTYAGSGSDWRVDGYADVPYGTSFQVPGAWSHFTTPGPPPLIAVDTPH